MSATIIPFELHLPTILPTIEGNVDYLDLRHQLVRMDQLLLASGLETKLVELAVGRWLGSKEKPPSAKAQTNYQTHCRRALRGNIARLLLKEDFRGFAVRLADSPLLQFFCGLNELGEWEVATQGAAAMALIVCLGLGPGRFFFGTQPAFQRPFDEFCLQTRSQQQLIDAHQLVAQVEVIDMALNGGQDGGQVQFKRNNRGAHGS